MRRAARWEDSTITLELLWGEQKGRQKLPWPSQWTSSMSGGNSANYAACCSDHKQRVRYNLLAGFKMRQIALDGNGNHREEDRQTQHQQQPSLVQHRSRQFVRHWHIPQWRIVLILQTINSLNSAVCRCSYKLFLILSCQICCLLFTVLFFI